MCAHVRKHVSCRGGICVFLAAPAFSSLPLLFRSRRQFYVSDSCAGVGGFLYLHHLHITCGVSYLDRQG
ncbi:hypothetical protein V8C43DRAFT_286452, partial [Trichoderma afarasin]